MCLKNTDTHTDRQCNERYADKIADGATVIASKRFNQLVPATNVS